MDMTFDENDRSWIVAGGEAFLRISSGFHTQLEPVIITAVGKRHIQAKYLRASEATLKFNVDRLDMSPRSRSSWGHRLVAPNHPDVARVERDRQRMASELLIRDRIDEWLQSRSDIGRTEALYAAVGDRLNLLREHEAFGEV